MNRPDIKSFKTYTEAKDESVVFTFGRFNPPTVGHEKLIKKVISVSKGNNYRIYVSQSSDPERNPLKYKEKVQLMRKMFPKYGRNIIFNKKVINVFNILVDLYDQGFREVTMVVGSDRVPEFKRLMGQYNGKKARHGFYEFSSINTVSAGDRDPDADDVSGMSASKMRAAAKGGDLESFSNGLPKSFGDKVGVFNLIRKRMGLKEMVNFRKHIDLGEHSALRERYIAKEIFNIGDEVVCLRTGTRFNINERKSTYVEDCLSNKYWIKDLLEVKQDKDVKDKKGTQPAKYFAKDADGDEMSKSTKDKRDAHFKKGAKKDDDDKSAYKPAPGDKGADTKPSKHTKKFKQMFGESQELGTDERKKHATDVTPGQIDEKLITFAKKAYPKSGHVVILAGGAGSGKGFILKNLVGLEGKQFDVDDLKSLALRAPKLKTKVQKELGIDLSKMDLTKGKDVSKVHEIVAGELNLPNKRVAAFFSDVIFKDPKDKPNVIFDVTLKDLFKLDSITRMVQNAGYDKKNTHIVWVVNDIEVAKVQNLDPKRGRVVPVEILVNTHRGASQTMLDIVKMGKGLKKYMDGDIVFAFNKINVDSNIKTSKKGGAFVKDADYFYVKRSGKPASSLSDMGDTILNKIRGYVPNANTWTLE
tara:strand:- start:14650 stop:16578 length:1929 start_codon:yes stop_codon:yes gene_type:complete